MVLSVEESKARRLAGMQKATKAMTAARRVHRALVNGRPPASEFRTPVGAVAAARTLHREIEVRMKAEGLEPSPADWGVSIAYVTPDLTALGATILYAPQDEAEITSYLTGKILLGTLFGIVDYDAEDVDGGAAIIAGARPFISTKQADGWLAELLVHVRLALQDERLHLRVDHP